MQELRAKVGEIFWHQGTPVGLAYAGYGRAILYSLTDPQETTGDLRDRLKGFDKVRESLQNTDNETKT